MKYEIFQITKSDMTFEVGLMHHDALTHADVAEHMQICIACTYDTTTEDVKVVGAGFCSSGYPVTCYGHSESLGISSRGYADENTLNSSMLQTRDANPGPFDMVSTLLNNFSDTCARPMLRLTQQRYIVGREVRAFNMIDENYVDLFVGMRLEYVGPSLDGEGAAVHIFKVAPDSEGYEDFRDGIYTVSDIWMMAIHVDSPEIRKLTRESCRAVMVDGAISVANLVAIVDPFPISEPHDQLVAHFTLLGDEKEVIQHKGSLEGLCRYFHIDLDKD